MLRPARLLPHTGLLTSRSARQISPTNRDLLLGAPVPTQTGLTPAGLIQLPERNMDDTLALKGPGQHGRVKTDGASGHCC